MRTRATRAAWTPGGALQIGPGLVRAVSKAVAWTLDDATTRRIAIVTLRPLELALRGALGEDAEPSEATPAEVLIHARRELGPILRRLPAPPDLGHYGAIRGLEAWKDHDALSTLGDPWPQLGDVQLEADLLELGSWEERGRALAAAELEQAHGRLRLVHRIRPARALHVCAVVPSGWEGRCEVEEISEATKSPPADLRVLVEAAGGFNRAVAVLGIGQKTLARYLAVERQAPPGLVERLQPELS